MRNQNNPASYSDYDPDEVRRDGIQPDYQDETDWTKCDKCEEEFDSDDLIQHEDGNTYCNECCYMTKEDHLDALVDSYDAGDL